MADKHAIRSIRHSLGAEALETTTRDGHALRQLGGWHYHTMGMAFTNDATNSLGQQYAVWGFVGKALNILWNGRRGCWR